jgi:hypothetical protein
MQMTIHWVILGSQLRRNLALDTFYVVSHPLVPDYPLLPSLNTICNSDLLFALCSF